MELIRLPAGMFTMGSPLAEVNRDGGETQFTATHSQDFYMGKTEVTQAQWSALQSDKVERGRELQAPGLVPSSHCGCSTLLYR